MKNGRLGAIDMPHRILVVDDHPVVHLGIKALLETERFATIIECPDFRKINLLIEKHRPDAILLDMHMPRFAIERDFRIILRQHPDEIYIAYSADEGTDLVERCRQLGFRGYLLKSTHFETVKNQILAILAGKKIFPEQTATPAGRSAPFSEAQLDILRLMASGMKNHDIAIALGVQDVTVNYHKRNIKNILAANTSVEAVILAKQHGWI